MPVLARCRSARPSATWPCSSSTGTTRSCAPAAIPSATRRTAPAISGRFMRSILIGGENLFVVRLVNRDDYLVAEPLVDDLTGGGGNPAVQLPVGQQHDGGARHAGQILGRVQKPGFAV